MKKPDDEIDSTAQWFTAIAPEPEKNRNFHYPLASEASREEANLNERKNPHTPVYGVKEFSSIRYIVVFRLPKLA